MRISVVQMFICLVSILGNLSAQEISYNYPREVFKYLGNVKSVFLYEYETKIDSSNMSKALILDSNINVTPSYSYHFDEENLMTHMLRYQGDTLSGITYYIYNNDGNLIYKIRKRGLTINKKENWDNVLDVIIKSNVDSSYQTIYTSFEEYNSVRIRNTGEVDISAYLYDMKNLQLFITGSLVEPSTSLKFDKEGRVIAYEYYNTNRGELRSSKQKWIYEGDLLKEKQIINPEVTSIHTYTYDSDFKILSEYILRTDSINNRMIKYEYVTEDFIEKRVFNDVNDLIYFTKEIKQANLLKTKSFKPNVDGVLVPYLYTIAFQDEVGNVIKRCKINYQKNLMFIQEYHFEYY